TIMYSSSLSFLFYDSILLSCIYLLLLTLLLPPTSTLFPYTTLFRSVVHFQLYVPDSSPFQSFDTLQVTQDFLMMFQFYHHIQKRSEEHTSELQSRFDLVCRLLLEKKKITDCV